MTNHQHFMSLKDAQDRVTEIKRQAETDPASADILERALWMDVLAEIRAGHPQPQELASLAMESYSLSFERVLLTLCSLPEKKRQQLLNTLALPKSERDRILQRLD